jgi:Protein of unknown function (DUF3106)
MAGQLSFLSGAAAIAIFALPTLRAQAPASAPAPPPADTKPRGPFGDDGGDKRRTKGDPADREKFETARKAIDALTPDQRKRFQENFLRWSNLSPEEKKALADRDTFRRKKIAEDIDAALKEAGLILDGDRREAFGKRYGEERHKIEEQLRKDIDEKRTPLLKEVVAKLKVEFSAPTEPAKPPPSPCPTKP